MGNLVFRFAIDGAVRQLALTPQSAVAIIQPLFSGLWPSAGVPRLFLLELRSISLETRVVRLLMQLVRTWCGRALVAWCALCIAAHVATAQYPAFDGPPRGMDPDREEPFVEDESILATDGDEGGPGSAMITDAGPDGINGPTDADYGPQVSQQYAAPYEYIEEQGLPFIMQQEGGAISPARSTIRTKGRRHRRRIAPA